MPETTWHFDYWSAVFTWKADRVLDRDTAINEIGTTLYAMPGAALFTPTGHRGRRFDQLYLGPDGIRLSYSTPKADGHHRLYLELKGQAFESLSLNAVARVLTWARSYSIGCSTTRLDLAWDHVPFTVEQAISAYDAGDVRTRAHRAREIFSRELGPNGSHPDDGRTCMIGDTSSHRCTRIYDQHGFVRCELQLREERAHAALLELLYLDDDRTLRPDGHELTARGLLIDYLEFVDATTSTNTTRRERLPWWAAFVEGAVRVRHIFARVKQSLERIDRWISKTVIASLATLRMAATAAGHDANQWLHERIREGEQRMNAWQIHLVAQEALEHDQRAGSFNYGFNAV